MNKLDNLKQAFELQSQFKHHFRHTSPDERADILNKITVSILRNKKEIEEALYNDLRKNDTFSGYADVYSLLSEVKDIRTNLKKWMKPQIIDSETAFIGTNSMITYEPKGVCLIHTHWSYPFFMPYLQLISCIAAGNTAILYLPHTSHHTTKLIRKLITDIFTTKLVYVLSDDELDIASVYSLPYDYVHFMGSKDFAIKIAEHVQPLMTNINYQISSKSPVVVDYNSELEEVIQKTIWAKFLNVGQTCVSPDYAIIPSSILPEFLSLLNIKLLEAFSDNPQQSKYYSRIVNYENFDRLIDLQNDALDHGAVSHSIYDWDRQDLYIGPQILTNIHKDSRIYKEEILGPILPILTYDTEEDIYNIINSHSKPLSLYIFSNNEAFAKNIIQNTQSGSVCINNCIIQIMHPKLPFGSTNSSGLAGSTGKFGFLNYSNIRPIVEVEPLKSITDELDVTVKKIFNWFKS